MARRNRKMPRDQEELSDNPTTRAQQTTARVEAAVGRAVPDQDLTVLGLSNVNRAFDLDDPTNGPACVFRRTYPFMCFIYGFTAAGSISDQDDDSATNTALSASAALYPVTRYAQYVESDVWPVLANLFASGTGQRYNISFSEFVRYNAMLYKAHSLMQTVMTINHLAYHFDWSSVTPFSPVVPKYIYDMATTLDATDVGLASRWLPLIRRFDTKVMFPRIIDDIKRMYTPMYSVDLHGRLLIPVYDFPIATDADTIQTAVVDLLDYLDVELKAASALFASFLPFPASIAQPFTLPAGGSIDIDRESGWLNSGLRPYEIFGDTGDPTEVLANYFSVTGTTAPDPALVNLTYFTRHTQATWAELRLSAVYEMFSNTVDDTYALISPHLYGPAYIVDDAQDYFEYEGQYIDYTSTGWRYMNYISCRYTLGGIAHGVQQPGTLGAEIGHDPYRRMIRQQVQYDWNLEVLKQISYQMSGASIRELRFAIQEAVVRGVNSPF